MIRLQNYKKKLFRNKFLRKNFWKSPIAPFFRKDNPLRPCYDFLARVQGIDFPTTSLAFIGSSDCASPYLLPLITYFSKRLFAMNTLQGYKFSVKNETNLAEI